jgi:hypothetical protein
MPSCPGFGFWFCLGGLLCLNQSGYEIVEVGWVDVADRDDAQVWCGGGVEGEACAGGVRTLLFLHVRNALKDRELQRQRTCPQPAFSVA